MTSKEILAKWSTSQLAALVAKMGAGNAEEYLRGEVECRFERVAPFLRVDRFEPFNPEKICGSKWRIWKGPLDGNGLEGDEQQDCRSLDLFEVRMTEFTLPALLKEREVGVTGLQLLDRFMRHKQILADAQIGRALFEEAGQSMLKWISLVLKVSSLEFPGTVLRSPSGEPSLLGLNRLNGDTWESIGPLGLNQARNTNQPWLTLAKRR